jgi:large subunit ribosomal protein L21
MSDLIFVDIKSKQYQVVVGEAVVCDFLNLGIGAKVILDQVVFLATKEAVISDPSTLKHYQINAKVVDEFRGEKILVFKKKRRKGYKKTIGHRQDHTLLLIESLEEQKH